MNKGFTLVETLVVIAIIGILGSLMMMQLRKSGVVGDGEPRYWVCASGGNGGGGSQCEVVKTYIEKDGCVIADETKFCGSYYIQKY